MGTRSLTMVYIDGEYKVAQYGQWDGYPEGQGVICLHFLRDEMKEEKFREALKEVRYLNRSDISDIWKEFGADEEGMIRSEDADRLKRAYPELNRDTAAKILNMIQERKLKAPGLQNNLEFAADSLFCEWAYVIDLDKRTFEVYEGFNTKELEETDRFYFLKNKEEGKYHGVKLLKQYSIDDLPTDIQFGKDCSQEEEEE